jgi:hypothetical protein
MAEEKRDTAMSETQLIQDDDDGLQVSWTADEERALVRR